MFDWSVLAKMSSSSSDFCSGGQEETPDQTILNILDASDFAEDEITYEAVSYYATVRKTNNMLLSYVFPADDSFSP